MAKKNANENAENVSVGEEEKVVTIEEMFEENLGFLVGNVRRTYKDMIFQKMFERVPEYKIRAIEQIVGKDDPDLQNLTSDEVQINSLANVFVNGMHNDVSFIVRGKLLLLMEAQSTWSVNIVFRLLVYYVAIVLQMVAEKESNGIYNSKKIPLPRAYFCCVYTGERKNVPDLLTLRTNIAESEDYPLEVKVKVIYNENDGILGEYIGAARTLDETIKKEGYTKANAVKAIDNCIKKGFLVEFMSQNREGVMDIIEIMNDVGLWGDRAKKENDDLSDEVDQLTKKNGELTVKNDELTVKNDELTDTIENAITQYLKKQYDEGKERSEVEKDLALFFKLGEESIQQYMIRYWGTL